MTDSTPKAAPRRPARASSARKSPAPTTPEEAQAFINADSTYAEHSFVPVGETKNFAKFDLSVNEEGNPTGITGNLYAAKGTPRVTVQVHDA